MVIHSSLVNSCARDTLAKQKFDTIADSDFKVQLIVMHRWVQADQVNLDDSKFCIFTAAVKR